MVLNERISILQVSFAIPYLLTVIPGSPLFCVHRFSTSDEKGKSFSFSLPPGKEFAITYDWRKLLSWEYDRVWSASEKPSLVPASSPVAVEMQWACRHAARTSVDQCVWTNVFDLGCISSQTSIRMVRVSAFLLNVCLVCTDAVCWQLVAPESKPGSCRCPHISEPCSCLAASRLERDSGTEVSGTVYEVEICWNAAVNSGNKSQLNLSVGILARLFMRSFSAGEMGAFHSTCPLLLYFVFALLLYFPFGVATSQSSSARVFGLWPSAKHTAHLTVASFSLISSMDHEASSKAFGSARTLAARRIWNPNEEDIPDGCFKEVTSDINRKSRGHAWIWNVVSSINISRVTKRHSVRCSQGAFCP